MATNSVLAKMAVLISANTAEFNRNLTASETRFQKFTATISRAAGTLGLAFGGVAIFQGLRAGIGIIQDFEQRMSEVNAITQASASEFKALRDSALELGKATKFSAEEVAQLQVEFGKLGFSTQEILNSTKATLELATATGEDLAGSAEIAGSTLRAFNLEATEMQRVVDVMAASFNKSALGLSNFGEAIKYVAPVAAAANISLEETTAMLGVLADAGIRGSMAGTSLRKIISDVKEETGTLAERLQKLSDKGLTGAEAMDEVGRTAYASLLILTEHIGKVNEATTAYQNASGEAAKMAALMGDNLAGDTKKLNSAFQSLILSGSAVSGTLREIVQLLTEITNFVNDTGVFQGAITGISNLLRQFLIIPAAAKAIRDWSNATEEAGITAAENAKIIEEVWGKAMVPPDWARNTEPLVKYFKDQQLYLQASFSMFGKNSEAVKENVTTLGTLIDAKKELIEQFRQTDINDKTKLANLAAEYKSTDLQIKQIEKLLETIEKKNRLEGKSVATPFDLSTRFGIGGQVETSEGFLKAMGLDPASIDEAIEKMKTSLKKLPKAFKEVSNEMIDIGPLIANAIIGIADAIGNALAGSEDFGQSLIKAVAGFAQQLGALFIATGVAEAAFQSGNPYAMIAAGAALVVLGAAINGMMAKQSGGSKGLANGGNSGAPGRLPSEVAAIRIEGEISGYSMRLLEVKDDYRRGRVG